MGDSDPCIPEVRKCMIQCVLQVWLSLADNYIREQCIDWTKTLRFAFNDRSNPDDDSLGIQIVKVKS